MSVDIAMLLEMDHLHPNMGSSPTRTSYSSPLNASSRLFVPVGSSPGHMVASSVMRAEERNPQTPVAATRIRLTGSVAGPGQYRTPQNLGVDSHHPLSRGTMKFSSSPKQGPAITVTSANVSMLPPPIVHSASFSFPRASTVSVVHEAELDGVAGLSPAGFNDDLHWQMYLTASLSNPLNTLNFEEDQPSHLELQYPTTLDGSSSLAAPSREPFDVFGSSPYMTKMASSRKLDVNRRECNQSSTNDQTLPIPNGTYAALMELTPPTFEFGSARFPSLEASVPRQNPSPLSSVPSPLSRGRSPTISRKGLSGWENDANHANPVQVSSVLQGPHNGRKRRRSTPTSPIAPRRAYNPSSAISSRLKVDAGDDCAATTASPLAFSLSNTSDSKKMMDRPSTFKQRELGFDSDNENVGLPSEGDADSDDYHPSRSVSPVLRFSRTSSLAAQSSLKRVHDSTRGDSFDEMNRLVPKKKTRRGKGKAKGSAALALAVVTQLGAKSRSLVLGVEDGDDEDNQEFDALALYRQFFISIQVPERR
ncbi:hypothetical protein CPC08DRAFT_296320 [Agrocybe pediades]|nr:hypothetical protein CPC08DRAFT_296320 [Agrocybe pediades]